LKRSDWLKVERRRRKKPPEPTHCEFEVMGKRVVAEGAPYVNGGEDISSKKIRRNGVLPTAPFLKIDLLGAIFVPRPCLFAGALMPNTSYKDRDP
jgi:hypothetical protein